MVSIDDAFDAVFKAALDKAAELTVDTVVDRAVRQYTKRRDARRASDSTRTAEPAESIARASWGPERLVVNAKDPYGYTPKPSFNCDFNNPNYGDERVLAIAKPLSNSDAGGWQTLLQVKPGAEYLVRVYYHNSASPYQVATGSRVYLSLPEQRSTSALVTCYIGGDNTEPELVWSHLVFESEREFKLEYVPGTGRLFTNAKPEGLQCGDGAFLPSGELIGSDQDGRVGGGYAEAGILTFNVRSI
ncbi:hypothetical protein [Rhodococcus sp. B10]|uniref:hypothetical protein n=1 Tax=Rhodococcus sp. B10 TaxID=2695876 RepID=UPI00142FA29C|nr:hypothetical protein [Rhodococcus sp. B10]NIL77165.1 hypothetical protein [Rhodococcus sp. B10]